jgi:hypothetical protein
VQVARRLSEGWFPILRFDAAVAEPTLMTALVRHRLFAGHRIDTVQADGRMQAEPQVHLFRRLLGVPALLAEFHTNPPEVSIGCQFLAPTPHLPIFRSMRQEIWLACSSPLTGHQVDFPVHRLRMVAFPVKLFDSEPAVFAEFHTNPPDGSIGAQCSPSFPHGPHRWRLVQQGSGSAVFLPVTKLRL